MAQSKSVEGVKKLVDSGIERVPQEYVRPEEQRPGLTPLVYAHDLPVIDMAELSGNQRSSELRALERACKESGFFYVKNHGISWSLSSEMTDVIREFFDQSSEEKMKYFSTDMMAPARYGTSFNPMVDNVLNWRDFLRLECIPDLESFWPDTPPGLREVASKYARQMEEVCIVIGRAVVESLGLPADYIEAVYGRASMVMVCNYYPSCPNPELTLGLAGHSDPGWLSVVNTVDQVDGLQIFKDNRWLQLRPKSDTLVVNLADQMEILSNGRYKSVEHRVVVNSGTDRVSVVTGFTPKSDKVVKPASPFLDKERALYNSCPYGKYLSSLYNRALNGKSGLESLLTNI